MPQPPHRARDSAPASMRIAVISPFLDRSHGTERVIIEQLEKFPGGPENEIHIYAQRVQDLRGVITWKPNQPTPPSNHLFWHRVPSIPGPHLLQYTFWFFANTIRRRSNRSRGGPNYDITYSPGINSFDADAIAVHIVFHEFHHQVISELGFRKNAVADWPRLIHRRLYYRLIMAVEKKVYRNPKVSLAAVSSLVAQQLEKYFQRKDARVIRNGVDVEYLSPSRRLAKRSSTRERFGLSAADFTLLLIGNDWKKKGLDGLLRALTDIRELPWKLIIVGNDERAPYERDIRHFEMSHRVIFLAPSPDVLQFYAAADAYVGPSLEDAYGLPVLEAMACGLPVLASSRAGVSDIIDDGINGIILRDPRNIQEITSALRNLITEPDLSRQLGDNAAHTAQNHTWARNAQSTWEWLNEVVRNRSARQCIL
jgi:glycosyltransferase involved in cell wall biosynthesis